MLRVRDGWASFAYLDSTRPRTTLVFRVIEEGRTGDVTVAGPRTQALFKNATGVARAVILQFKPGWSAPLLGVAANALTDRIVPLEDIWGRSGGDLCLELLAARSLPEVLDRVSHAIALRTHQSFEPASARLARRAVRLLEENEVRVESVAERLGVTARHLRRAFMESVGIGPKDFARTVRLQRAVRMAATSKDWGRIALNAGYYDQAHLIGDFRDLVGLTPSAFLKRAGDRGGRFGTTERLGIDFQRPTRAARRRGDRRRRRVLAFVVITGTGVLQRVVLEAAAALAVTRAPDCGSVRRPGRWSYSAIRGDAPARPWTSPTSAGHRPLARAWRVR